MGPAAMRDAYPRIDAGLRIDLLLIRCDCQCSHRMPWVQVLELYTDIDQPLVDHCASLANDQEAQKKEKCAAREAGWKNLETQAANRGGQ